MSNNIIGFVSQHYSVLILMQNLSLILGMGFMTTNGEITVNIFYIVINNIFTSSIRVRTLFYIVSEV